MTDASRPPAWLEVAPELRELLSPRRRHEGAVSVPLDGTSTLGHLVESVGVPLPEVGGLAVGGVVVAPSVLLEPGARVRVSAVHRPQSLPEMPPAFLLDVHLGRLARRMRLLGLDTAYHNDAADDELAERSRVEHRILLTQDRGLLMRRAVWLGAYVRGSRADGQLADVLGRFAPPVAPWTRCTACNGLLGPVPKEEVEHLLEPGTRRTQDRFWRCGTCARVYWPGAHARRLQVAVDAALAQMGHGVRAAGAASDGWARR